MPPLPDSTVFHKEHTMSVILSIAWVAVLAASYFIAVRLLKKLELY